MTDIRQHCAQDPAEIESAMVVKTLVLGRYKGVDDILRNIVDRHEHPVFTGIFSDQRPVASMDPAHDRGLILRQLLIIGQVIGDPNDIDRHSNEADNSQNNRSNPAPQGGTHDITQSENFHDALWTPAPTVRLQDHDTAAALWPPSAEAQTDLAGWQLP